MSKKINIRWKRDDDFLEAVKLLIPYFNLSEIGRILNRDRRTIHYVYHTYKLYKYKDDKPKLPLIIIKSKDRFEKDLKNFKND